MMIAARAPRHPSRRAMLVPNTYQYLNRLPHILVDERNAEAPDIGTPMIFMPPNKAPSPRTPTSDLAAAFQQVSRPVTHAPIIQKVGKAFKAAGQALSNFVLGNPAASPTQPGISFGNRRREEPGLA